MSGEQTSGGHTEPEALAAFLEGALPAGERQRTVAHLAECEDCYELFADAARFLAEERALSPEARSADLLRPPNHRWRRLSVAGAALAAAAVIALLVASPARRFLDFTTPPPSVAELTARLPAATLSPILETTWQEQGWTTTRGGLSPSAAEQVRAFQLGVRVVHMEIALAAGDAELSRHLAQDLGARLEGLDPLPLLYTSDQGILGQLRAGAAPASLRPLNRDADLLLAPGDTENHPGFVNGDWYRLGRWAGAADLASAAGEASFFTERANRRFLQRTARLELPPSVTKPVGRLEELVTDRPEDHLAEIERAVEELIAVAGGGDPSDTRR